MDSVQKRIKKQRFYKLGQNKYQKHIGLINGATEIVETTFVLQAKRPNTIETTMVLL
jgi:hypothetical protein